MNTGPPIKFLDPATIAGSSNTGVQSGLAEQPSERYALTGRRAFVTELQHLEFGCAYHDRKEEGLCRPSLP